MINAKSSVKLLRRAGLVLIALPEAVTTPVGVAFLLTARYLSKKIEADLYKRLHGTFQHYLAHTRRNARGDADESDEKKKTVKHHAPQNADRLIPKPETNKPLITGAKAQKSSAHSEEAPAVPAQKKTPAPKADSGPVVIKGQRGPEIKPVHHDVDIKWLSRRYALTDSQTPTAQEDNQDSEKSEHHDIDRQKIAKRFGISESPKTETMRKDGDKQTEDKNLPHHNIDRQKIARRFGIASASKETPRKAEDKTEDDVEKNSIRHDIDRQKIARRFNLESGKAADAASADKTGKTARPAAKAKAPAEKPEAEEDKPKTNHHKIDAASLRRRYGGPAPR